MYSLLARTNSPIRIMASAPYFLLLVFLISNVAAATARQTVDLGYATYEGIFNSTIGVTSFLGMHYASPPTGKSTPIPQRVVDDLLTALPREAEVPSTHYSRSIERRSACNRVWCPMQPSWDGQHADRSRLHDESHQTANSSIKRGLSFH